MFTQIKSLGLFGLNAFPVDVEVSISRGNPQFEIVGLPDASVRESRERIRAALTAMSVLLPPRRITVNLAPADVKKIGTMHDLAILLGILVCMQMLSPQPAGRVFLGEVSLSGQVRSVNGVLPMALLAAQTGAQELYVPAENAAEAAAAGIPVYAVRNVEELIAHLEQEAPLPPQPETDTSPVSADQQLDFADVKGQQNARYALEIAAAGGHNALMIGSPGSGKTVTAAKIAKMLSARKKNVILLLCDMAAPMLPCICPADALESNGSLAGVLAAARISENLIKHNLVTFKRNSCLAVLGLLERQNEYSTPPFTQKQVVELLDGLRQIAPYVIVDCGSYIANDILSAVALMEADSILRLANCDPKSVNYFASQLPLLDGPEWDMDKQYKVASNVKPYQAADLIGKVLGDTAFVLPYSQELEEQYLAGNLLADLALKDSRPFRKELDRIIAEVF